MTSYTVDQYLLDRVFIQDSVTKLWRFYDQRLTLGETVEKVKNECFTAQVYMDYEKLLGAPPYNTTGEEQATQWYKLLSQLESSIHLIGHVLTDLPAPGEDVQRPDMTIANVQAIVVLRVGEKLSQNAAMLNLTMVRTEGAGNTWRISEMRLVDKVYDFGDKLFA